MNLYRHIAQQWKKPTHKHGSPQWDRLIQWRSGKSFERIERPTRLDRARSLGYKAKQGYIIVRARVRKGGLRKSRPNKGRKPSRMGFKKITPAKSIQRIAEERVAKRYPNMEVLNSYWVGKDGKSHYYEVILVDSSHPVVANDFRIRWISADKNRVLRGKTSVGKKGRGLRKKGTGSEKTRPSLRVKKGRGK
jgi:large subunit ribosomal protein L15e